MPPAIQIEGLGKRYRVNHAAAGASYRTLRESLGRLATAPLRRLRGGGHDGTVEDFWALRDVSFDVQPGEVVGIIGRNGAGKSTLLKILSRIAQPTTGCVKIRGRVASLLEVGTGFHPELTGRENVYLNGSFLGMSREEIRRKFDEIVEFSGVERFLDTPVKRFSSGMQVRLAFAVAAHLDPEILIIDEVLAVGDASFKKKCIGKMQEVGSSGRTILFVSHDLTALSSLCQRGILLDQGTVRFQGEIDAAISAYMQLIDSNYSKGTTASLESAPGRTRGSRRIMRSISVGGDENASGVVTMGEDLEFHVRFDSESGLQDIAFGFVIKTMQNTPVFGMNNRVLPGLELDRTVHTGVVGCTVPGVPLMPGRYGIDLYFGSFGHDDDIILDAIQFEVASADLFGSGRLPHASGAVVLPVRWELNELED